MKRKPIRAWAFWCDTLGGPHAPLNWVRAVAEATMQAYESDAVLGCGPHRLVELVERKPRKRKVGAK